MSSLTAGDSFQAAAQGGKPRQSPALLLSWGGRAHNLGRPRRLEFPGKRTRESTRERERERQRAPEIAEPS